MGNPLGKEISKAERIAPKGKYRVILGDTTCGRIYLVEDSSDYKEARKIARASRSVFDNSIGYAVHDDTGKIVYPADDDHIIRRVSAFSDYAERERKILAA